MDERTFKKLFDKRFIKACSKTPLNDCLYVRGTKHPAAKLTEENVYSIRKAYANGDTIYAKLSKEFGVSICAIHRIVKRKTWKHVP